MTIHYWTSGGKEGLSVKWPILQAASKIAAYYAAGLFSFWLPALAGLLPPEVLGAAVLLLLATSLRWRLQ